LARGFTKRDDKIRVDETVMAATEVFRPPSKSRSLFALDALNGIWLPLVGTGSSTAPGWCQPAWPGWNPSRITGLRTQPLVA